MVQEQHLLLKPAFFFGEYLPLNAFGMAYIPLVEFEMHPKVDRH